MNSIETFSTKKLQSLYLKKFAVDVQPYIKSNELVLRENADGVQYFEGVAPGDGRFYEHLSSKPWYYEEEKDEHTRALNYIMQAECAPRIIVDVGAGRGGFLRRMKKALHCRCIGVEFNDAARQAMSNAGLEVAASCKELAAAGVQADVVTSFQVLEHVDDYDAFLNDLKSILKPGGTLILSTPNRDGFQSKLKWHLLDMPPHHMTRWNINSFLKVGTKHGLQPLAFHIEPLRAKHRYFYYYCLLNSVPAELGLRRALSIFLWAITPQFALQFVQGHTVLAFFEYKQTNGLHA